MLSKGAESEKGAQKRKQQTRQKWVKECSKIDFGGIFDPLKIVWTTLPVTIRVVCTRLVLGNP